MLQVVVKKGKILTENVPSPSVSSGSVLIKVHYSCISAGTEISAVNASGKSLIRKALDQPANFKKAFDLAKSEGIEKALTKIQASQNTTLPLGYSIAGEIIAIGKNVTGFSVGEIVAAAGAGIANHAEFVDVPINLVLKSPSGLHTKYSSTVALGGISLQGVRRLDLRLGEYAVVVGAGILGLLALQMLKASGARVIVTDIDEARLKIASLLGADFVINAKNENLLNDVSNFTNGYGADGVLFTAATAESEPLSQAFKMCKRKGRVVLVGVAGSALNRDDMYEKELDFLISTSYGPGRYDSNYELKGIDYPYAYVRWTEKRNMEEYLKLISDKKINLDPIINHTVAVENADQAFSLLKSAEMKPLIVLLEYKNSIIEENQKFFLNSKNIDSKRLRVGLIGAGNFADAVHLPNLKKLKNKMEVVALSNRSGLKAKNNSEKYEALWFTTNPEEIVNDPNIDLVMVSTRHDSHASYVLKCLKSGKNVFVEKPLAVTEQQIEEIRDFITSNQSRAKLFVGFNRRFSPFAREIKKELKNRVGPVVGFYRVNAGFLNREHWVHEDGGRIIGEACHIVDLAKYLIESNAISLSVDHIDSKSSMYNNADNRTITIKYSDGSIFTIAYFSNGSPLVSKEYMEVHFDGKSIIMDDYNSLTFYGIKKDNIQLEKPNKGHLEELEIIADNLLSNSSEEIINFSDLIETTELSILAAAE